MLWLTIGAYVVGVALIEVVGRWQDRRLAAHEAAVARAKAEQRRVMMTPRQDVLDQLMIDCLLLESGTAETYEDTDSESYI
jgi:hypothetical protein